MQEEFNANSFKERLFFKKKKKKCLGKKKKSAKKRQVIEVIFLSSGHHGQHALCPSLSYGSKESYFEFVQFFTCF